MNTLLYDQQGINLCEDPTGNVFVKVGHDSVLIVALQDHKVLFVREKSIAYQLDMLSLPMGQVEFGEFPVVAANRVLQEEAGYQADALEYVGTLHPSVKFIHWECHVFLGSEIVPSQPPAQPNQSIWLQAINRYIVSGQLSNSTTIAALHLVWRHLRSASRLKPVVVGIPDEIMDWRI